MKQILITLTAILSLGSLSCKKGYTCTCSTEYGYYDGFDIHEMKRRADKKCKEYYKAKYDTVTVSNVKCELKKGE